jgi:hypothetical protein
LPWFQFVNLFVIQLLKFLAPQIILLKFYHRSGTFYWISIWFRLKYDLTFSLTFNYLILRFQHTINNFQPRLFVLILILNVIFAISIKLAKSRHFRFFLTNWTFPCLIWILLRTKYLNFPFCDNIRIRIIDAFNILLWIIFKRRVWHYFLRMYWN